MTAHARELLTEQAAFGVRRTSHVADRRRSQAGASLIASLARRDAGREFRKVRATRVTVARTRADAAQAVEPAAPECAITQKVRFTAGLRAALPAITGKN